MMKALVLERPGDLIFKDVPMPLLRDDEVLLNIKACGICSSDFDRCLKTGTYKFPTIPGHEFAGCIEAVGKSVDPQFVGRRAVVFPLLPDHSCDQCQAGAFARCRNYNYHGSRCDGGFAEYLATPIWNIQTFSDSLDYKVAALCEPAAVAYHAVSEACLTPNSRVCIVGTGTIGILVGLWSKMKGSDVSFVCRTESKAEYLRTFGFDRNLVDTHDALGSFDVVFECVGTDSSLASSINVVNTAGTIVLVGNPDGDKHIPRNVYWRILRSELTVKGVWNSQYAPMGGEWRNVLSEFEKNPVPFSRLITHEFPLSAGLEAFHSLRSASELVIKGMFLNE